MIKKILWILCISLGMAENSQFIYVSTGGDDSNNGSEQSPVKTITMALEMISGTAGDPGIIYVDIGTYSPSLTGETFPISALSNINIVGSGADITILDAEQTSRVFDFINVTNSSLSHMALTGGGEVYNGGAILMENSDPHIDNVIIRDNWAYGKCALDIVGSDAIITNSIIRDNSVYDNNYGDWTGHTMWSMEFSDSSQAILSHVAIHSNNDGNHAHSNAGIRLLHGSDVIFNDVTFTDHGGGNNTRIGIIIQDSSPQFINSSFTDNYGYNCSSSENCSSYYQCDQGWLFYVVGTSAFPHWKNSIIHGNGPTEIFLEGEDYPVQASASYSNIRGSFCPANDGVLNNDSCNCTGDQATFLADACIIECDPNDVTVCGWASGSPFGGHWNDACHSSSNGNGIIMNENKQETWIGEYNLDIDPEFNFSWSPDQGNLIPENSDAYLDKGDPNPIYNDQIDNSRNDLGAHGGSNIIANFDYYNFGDVAYGSSNEISWKLTNLRDETITITDASLSNPSKFQIVNTTFPINIEPYQDGVITVKFEPASGVTHTPYYLAATPSPSNYQSAENYCQSYGGHLASIHSQEQFDAVGDWQDEQDLWRPLIGAYAAGCNNCDNFNCDTFTWAWTDGSTFDFLPTCNDIGAGDCNFACNDENTWSYNGTYYHDHDTWGVYPNATGVAICSFSECTGNIPGCQTTEYKGIEETKMILDSPHIAAGAYIEFLGMVSSIVFGDINQDGDVNVLDIVLLVDTILSGDIITGGDINQDGAVNILDIVALIGIILN